MSTTIQEVATHGKKLQESAAIHKEAITNVVESLKTGEIDSDQARELIGLATQAAVERKIDLNVNVS